MSCELSLTPEEMPEPARPWGAFLFLLAIFAVASFDPLQSVDYVLRKDKSAEQRLEESVQRTEAGNVVRRVALAGLGIFAVGMLMQQSSNQLKIKGVLGILIVFFVLWAPASCLWSYDAALTMRRVVILGLLCLGAVAVARRFTFEDIVFFAFMSGCATIVAGFACELALGSFIPRDPEYRFAGVMNPIFQGAHSGMAVLAALALATTSRRARSWWLLAAMAAFLAMLLTRSRGPAGATLAAAFVFGCLMFPRLRTVLLFLLAFVAIALISSPVRNQLLVRGEDTLLFGREVERVYEMQGRDALWKECLKFSSRRPVLGYGYDAFWTRDLTFAVTDASGFTSQHTHNAFLDLLLGIGMPGAFAYTFIILLSMVMLFSLWRQSHSAAHAVCLAFLILYAIHNLFVSVHLAAQLQTFVVLVIVAKLGLIDSSSSIQISGVETANDGANHQHQPVRV